MSRTSKLKKNTFFKIVISFSLSFVWICSHANTPPNVIKLALLSSIYDETVTSQTREYMGAYLAGADTAAYAAKKYGLHIEYQPFIYSSGPLDVLDEVPKVEQWQADLVIGPGSSDQFLLLRNHLSNVMVISPFASGIALKSLPKNFYSIFLPDDEMMYLLGKYIQTTFPSRNVFIIEQTDCKQCVDAGSLFASEYKKIAPNTQVSQEKLIIDHPNSIDSEALMKGHENDVTLILTFSQHSFKILAEHIAHAIPNNHFIFFSDQDNWGSAVKKDYKKTNKSYDSYRIGPLLSDPESKEYRDFESYYYTVFHKKPTDSVSYMIYTTAMSALEALQEFPSPDTHKNMREKILYSYTQALKKDPDWFRVRDYGIYETGINGEFLVARLNTAQLSEKMDKQLNG